MLREKLDYVNMVLVLIVLVYLCIWLPLAAGAQAPTPTPQISATWWVVPELTLTPFEPTSTVTPTPTEIVLLPWKRVAYLPLIVIAKNIIGDVR